MARPGRICTEKSPAEISAGGIGSEKRPSENRRPKYEFVGDGRYTRSRFQPFCRLRRFLRQRRMSLLSVKSHFRKSQKIVRIPSRNSIQQKS